MGRGDLPEFDVGHVILDAFAVLGNEGVEIHQRSQPSRHAVGDVANDKTGIRMTDEHDVPQLFPDQEIGDVIDMGLHTEAKVEQMRALAQTGKRGGEHPMTRGGQPVAHTRPDPAAAPGSVDENIIGHWNPHGLFARPKRDGEAARYRAS